MPIAQTDPQQRMFLQICHETLEHAGYAGAGGRIGVYAGSGMTLYSLRTYLRENLGDIDGGDQIAALPALVLNCPPAPQRYGFRWTPENPPPLVHGLPLTRPPSFDTTSMLAERQRFGPITLWTERDNRSLISAGGTCRNQLSVGLLIRLASGATHFALPPVWWKYTSGALGVLYIGLAALLVRDGFMSWRWSVLSSRWWPPRSQQPPQLTTG